MNKRLDLTNNGGFPATQYSLDYMQDSYRSAFMGIAAFIGDKIKVSGMVDIGPQTTNGWISWGGELIPFIGGVRQDVFLIEEVTEDRVFNDNVSHTVYYKKQARFGGALDFTQLKSIGTISTLFYSLCPIGSVIPYEGDLNALPAGWVVDELKRGRVIVGQDTGDADFDTIGNTGGFKQHTQTVQEMPAHSHKVTQVGDRLLDQVNHFRVAASNTDANGEYDIAMQDTGGGVAMPILFPYYVTAMIKRIS